MMVHPAAVEMAAMPGSAVASSTCPTAAARARGCLSRTRGQRRRRDDRRPGGHRAAAPADRRHATASTASSPRPAPRPNVIPDASRGRWIVRTDTVDALAPLTARVQRCFEAGATRHRLRTVDHPGRPRLRGPATRSRAAGALPRQRRGPRPDLPRPARRGSRRSRHRHGQRLPRRARPSTRCSASTAHPPSTTNRSSPRPCITPTADRAVLDGAVAMAWTAADLASASTSTT